MKIKYFSLIILGISVLFANAVNAQFQGAESETIPTDKLYVVSFHRPVLDAQGNLIRIPGTNTVQVEKALSAAEINQGFKVNDRVVVRVKAPLDSYIYVVNNSTWDGVRLVNNNVSVKKDTEQDFIYRLTNNNNGTQTKSTEELLFLIRRTPFNESEMNAYLVQTGANTAPKININPTTPPTVPTPSPSSGGGQVIIKTACKVASIFFPWVGGICKATGFGAASAEPLPLPNEQTGLKPETNTENMIVQFSFSVSK